MKFHPAWRVEFFPYDTEVGRKIAGSLKATFLFEPTPEEVLEALTQGGVFGDIEVQMRQRILNKDYFMIKPHISDGMPPTSYVCER